MPIPFVAWIFQGIPECIAVATLVFSLNRESMQWCTIAQVGLLQAITLYLIRLLPLSPYFHVILGVVTLAIYCGKFGKLDIELSYIYSLFAVLVVMVIEFVFMYLFNYLRWVTYDQFLGNTPIRILAGLPQVLVILLLAWYFAKRKRNGGIALFNQLSKQKRENGKRNVANFGEL